MKLTKTIKKLVWYLKRPSYYQELFRTSTLTIKDFLLQGKRSKEKVESLKYCQKHAITQAVAIQEIIKQLGLSDSKIEQSKTLLEKYPQELKFAKAQSKASPVKMGGGSDFELLYLLCEIISAKRVIETGVAYGWSSLGILLSLQKRNESQLVSIDKPYPGKDNEKQVGCVIAPRLKQKWKLLRHADHKGIPLAISRYAPFDLCHYDSDKSVEGRRFAYPLLWNSLREEGIFISDDIEDNLEFFNFCQQKKITPIIVQKEHQFLGIVIKRS